MLIELITIHERITTIQSLIKIYIYKYEKQHNTHTCDLKSNLIMRFLHCSYLYQRAFRSNIKIKRHN